MDPFACLLAATAAVYLFASFMFAFAYLRRQADAEYGVFALLCLALVEYAAGGLLAAPSVAVTATLAGDKLRWVGLIVAFAMLVHFALRYGGIARPGRAAFPVYGIAALYAGFDARGMLHDATRITEFRRLPLRDLDIVYRGAPLTGLGLSAYALGCVAVAACLVLVARAYLGGRREALAVVVGTTVLLATVINDIGVATGALPTAYLVNAGFVAFVFSVATTYSARYASAATDLEKRTRELRTRTRELRRSYEELRTAQEELVRQQQLAVVGELAAVIAHEVRNPLAIIGQAVANLRKPISKDDTETCLTILEEETTRLNRLVTDLLRYARPVNVQRTHIILKDLIERSLQLIKSRKNMDVDFKDEAADARIWGDNNLLRQVFDNLIDNAVQAMGTAGTLTVRMRPMNDEGVEGLAVDIMDTGEGMDTQVRSRARDPFFTTRPSGTGLGLAIVDRIVDAHGGRFIIDSHAGEGTTVTVFLPYGSSSEPPPKPKARKPTSEPPPPRESSPDAPPGGGQHVRE